PFLYPDCPFGPFTVACTPASGSTFPVGTTTVNCVGSDGCGEHPTCSFHVTVNPRIIIPHWFAVALLPPLNGQYVPPPHWQQSFANGIIISNVSLGRFLPSFPPPAPGTADTHTFNSEVRGEVSMDGGQTFAPFSGSADVTI